jgi:putative endonuclease
MCWVYLLECNDKTYYCGATTDLKRRIKQHSLGKGARYTKSRLPVKLVWSKECGSYSEALTEEWKIKQLSRKKKEVLVEK